MWDASTAATARPSHIESAAWSPCNRFIAIAWGRKVEVLDSATLQQLQTLESPQDVPTEGAPMGSREFVFSPDSRILTRLSCDYEDKEVFAISWDLQTGGVASVVGGEEPALGGATFISITYSANGQMFGILYYPRFSEFDSDISIYDVASGVLINHCSLGYDIPLGGHIWTHGESLRFATLDVEAITIWEVGFTSDACPTEVETLPVPDELFDVFDEIDSSELDVRIFPTPYRLVLSYWSLRQVLVWDVQSSSYLLECAGVVFYSWMSFSPDGRFFACSAAKSDIYLWKESPTGYTLHGIFAINGNSSSPLLSPNGESIVAFGGCTIQLWPTLPSSILTQVPRSARDFIVEFSPDGMLAVVAMQEDNTVTVLNLTFGVPRLTINAEMEIYGLGVIGNSVVVIGSRKVIAWNLPGGDRVPSACAGLGDSSWTINISNPNNHISGSSISPDSRHIAIHDWGHLYIYSASTGDLLWNKRTGGLIPRFSPDGCDVWCVRRDGGAKVWRVSEEREMPEPLVDMTHPPEGYPWVSSRGYRVTDDWWILSPGGKRLLLLPPPWQSFPVDRVWKGQFLALLHCGPPEAVILELEVNYDL